MTTDLWISYTVFFILSFLFSLLANSLFLKFSRTLGMRNQNENLERWSPELKPSLGGLTFFIIFLLSAACYTYIFKQSVNFRNLSSIGVMLAAILGFLMGLFDDAYNTKVPVKLGTQVLCGIILISTGTYIQLTGSWVINYALTIFWVVGIMNSINMLDNMDAITGSVSMSIIFATLISIFLKLDFSDPNAVMLIGLLASLAGFLKYNWYPSKMIMGDTGSQFLGVILAAIGISYFWNFKDYNGETDFGRQIILTLVVFGLPITDTLTVTIKRIRSGNSPFVGGRDHTTHHLSYLGLKDNQVAQVFIFLSLIMVLLSICIQFLILEWSLLYDLIFSVYLLLQFGTLFYIANKNK